jgi:Ig-like domain-containing protein/cysteine-rich secretory family protein
MRNQILTVSLAAIALASCITISPPEPVGGTPLFVTAILPSTRTPVTTPATPSPAVVSTALSAVASCQESAVLVQDVTIPDGTNVEGGGAFTKTWQFQNTGSCSWIGYTIAFVSGDRMSAPGPTPVTQTAPNSTVNVSVDLVAPSNDGTYTGFFELHNASGDAVPIGIERTFWVKITVGTVIIQPTAGPLGTPSGGTPVSQPKGPASCTYTVSWSYPNEIASLINQARARNGLGGLTLSAQLTAAAQGHSIDMACFSLLSHTGSNGSSIYDRILASGYTPAYWEEIIYAGGYPQTAFDWWMNDPVHHDAILNANVTEMGVGYAYVSDSAYGGYYTVDFGSR